jgi:beta-1,4-mannosyltransferase
MMSSASRAPDEARPWYLVTRYPEHASPYFAELCAANCDGRPMFRCTPALPSLENPRGVVNLHRLKRLYRTEDEASPRRFLGQLRRLKAAGFPIVWTLHNLYPIEGPAVSQCDRRVTRAVLDLSNVVLCHTQADARAIQSRTNALVAVSGWAGISRTEERSLPPGLEALLISVDQSAPVFLVFGNQTPYKETMRIATLFLQATHRATLLIIGPCADAKHATELRRLAHRSAGRLRLWFERVEPVLAHRLYAAGSVAVCHYASSGRYASFRKVLYPSSVATAVGLGLPVLGPRLPSLCEITASHPAILYESSDAAIVAAMRRAAGAFRQREARPGLGTLDQHERWRRIVAVYRQVSSTLREISHV